MSSAVAAVATPVHATRTSFISHFRFNRPSTRATGFNDNYPRARIASSNSRIAAFIGTNAVSAKMLFDIRHRKWNRRNIKRQPPLGSDNSQWKFGTILRLNPLPPIPAPGLRLRPRPSRTAAPCARGRSAPARRCPCRPSPAPPRPTATASTPEDSGMPVPRQRAGRDRRHDVLAQGLEVERDVGGLAHAAAPFLLANQPLAVGASPSTSSICCSDSPSRVAERERFRRRLDEGREPEIDRELHGVARAVRPHVRDLAGELLQHRAGAFDVLGPAADHREQLAVAHRAGWCRAPATRSAARRRPRPPAQARGRSSAAACSSR